MRGGGEHFAQPALCTLRVSLFLQRPIPPSLSLTVDPAIIRRLTMVGLLDSPEAIHRAFNRGTSRHRAAAGSSDLDIAIRAASVFRQVDLYFTPPTQHNSTADNETPDNSQNLAHENFANIHEDATTTHTQLSEPEIVQTIIDGSGHFEARHSPPKPQGGTLDRVNVGKSTSLDSRVVLGDEVPNDLENLRYALLHQLSCCNAGHLLRLKLDGFYNSLNAQQRMPFHVYVSSQYTRKPPRWVQRKCTMTRFAFSRLSPSSRVVSNEKIAESWKHQCAKTVTSF